MSKNDGKMGEEEKGVGEEEKGMGEEEEGVGEEEKETGLCTVKRQSWRHSWAVRNKLT